MTEENYEYFNPGRFTWVNTDIVEKQIPEFLSWFNLPPYYFGEIKGNAVFQDGIGGNFFHYQTRVISPGYYIK